MATPLHKQVLPAVALAAVAALIARRANANAAQALGLPVALVALAVAVLVARASATSGVAGGRPIHGLQLLHLVHAHLADTNFEFANRAA